MCAFSVDVGCLVWFLPRLLLRCWTQMPCVAAVIISVAGVSGASYADVASAPLANLWNRAMPAVSHTS